MLSEVHHITLTIPVTSATAERTFSAMRRLKTQGKGRLTRGIPNEFISANERRGNIFGPPSKTLLVSQFMFS